MAAFSEGLNAGRALRMSGIQRKALEQQAEQAKLEQTAKQIMGQIEAGRAQTGEAIKGMTGGLVAALKGGAKLDDPGIVKTKEMIDNLLMIQTDVQREAVAFAVESGYPENAAHVTFGVPGDFARKHLAQVEAALALTQSEVDEWELVSPQELGAIGERLPKGSVMQRNAETGETKFLFDPTNDPSAIEERRAMFIEAGATPEHAAGLAAGRYELILDPVTRVGRVFDKVDQEFIGDITPEQTTPDAASVVPEGMDPAAAVGAGGMFLNAVNTVTDAVGLGAPAEKNLEATVVLENIQQTTKLALQVAIPGRPAKDIREDLKRLTVSPNSLFQGEERARAKFGQMVRFIEAQIAEKQQAIESGLLKPADIGTLRMNLVDLNQMLEAHKEIMSGFDSEDQGLVLSEEGSAALDIIEQRMREKENP